jgi:hypothetical protein
MGYDHVFSSLRGRAAHSLLVPPFPGFLKGSCPFEGIVAGPQKIERTEPRMLDPQNDVGGARQYRRRAQSSAATSPNQ